MVSMNEGESSVEISLTVKNTAEALEFYTNAFGAQELFRIPTGDGGIAHAEFQLGNSRIFVSDEAEDWHAFALPEGATASSLFVIPVDGCDQSYQKALAAGAERVRDPENLFFGVRVGVVKDPFGYRWSLREVIEELGQAELLERAQKLFGAT